VQDADEQYALASAFMLCVGKVVRRLGVNRQHNDQGSACPPITARNVELVGALPARLLSTLHDLSAVRQTTSVSRAMGDGWALRRCRREPIL